MGMRGFSTAVSCFHLTFPAVSALVGYKGRGGVFVCIGWGLGFGHYSSGIWPGNHDLTASYRGIAVQLMIRVSLSKRLTF